MLYNTNAVVIRSIPYGETHAIVTLLTPLGTVAAMARGAKKPQSRLSASVQLCTEGVFSIYQKSGMGSIQQAELTTSRRVLREQLELAAYAAYFCELVQAIAEERPNGSSALYEMFSGTLDRLAAQKEHPGWMARMWETKVLHWLGASPVWTRCVSCFDEVGSNICYSFRDGGFLCERCAPHSKADERRQYLSVSSVIPVILERFARTPWNRLGTLSLTQPTLKAVQTILTHQLDEFAGLSLKSRKVLESMNL